MMIGSSVNQLRGDANSFSFALHRSFEYMRHAKLLPDVSRAEDVRDALGPPHRSYRLPGKVGEVWEYQLEGFQRPLTLHVQLSSDQIVREVFMLERRGTASRDKR